jgi:very-short-patch-repair endonuclease
VQVPPVQQFSVSLAGGDYTVADWAFPDQRLLIFIDGMSVAIHGNPQQQKKDKLKRAKAKMAGWHVVEMTAQELDDDASMSARFEEISVYLGVAE